MKFEFNLESATKEELKRALLGLAQDHDRALDLIAKLQAEIAEFKGQKMVSAAPFSKGHRKDHPKRPGRHAGEGTFTNRGPPPEQDITTKVAVPLDVKLCPRCGVPLNLAVELATITDIPVRVKAIITGFFVEVGTCPCCGCRQRAAHPDLPADQFGATAHRLGPGVKAVALALHYEKGMPLRKVPSVIAEMFGITLTQSALTQCAEGLASKDNVAGQAYAELRAEICHAERVHTDDTGWKTNGEPAHLMGFFTDDTAFYQIRERHRNEEVREVIPGTYEGTLNTDRFRSYDAEELAEVAQQKCVAHIQRNLSDLAEKTTARAKCFALNLKQSFHESLELWHRERRGEVTAEQYQREGAKLREQIDWQLRDRPLTNPANQSMLDELGWHNDRGNLLRFLSDPRIEPTNNLAERMLRPAVIARKVSQCSKNERGARTYAVFKSIVTTMKLRATQTAKTVIAQLRDLIGGKWHVHNMHPT